MFWMSANGTQLARDEDIMIDINHGDEFLNKYSASLNVSNPSLIIYTLTILYVDERDSMYGGFRCVADVVGYPVSTWPNDQVRLVIEGLKDYDILCKSKL